MSRFNLAKKLVPAKKAWKNFTKTLQSKINNLKRTKFSIKKTTLLRLLSLCAFRRKPTLNSFNHHHSHRNIHPQNHSSAIYVDQLFSETTINPVMYQNSKGKENFVQDSSTKVEARVEDKEMKMNRVEKEYSVSSVDEAWNKVCLSNGLKFRGVDERAEEFISKFRQDMEIQREQSILDYQEMLARGL